MVQTDVPHLNHNGATWCANKAFGYVGDDPEGLARLGGKAACGEEEY